MDCLQRMFEFVSVRDEYELQYGMQPDDSLRDDARKLTLEDIIELALLNSREYQAAKERQRLVESQISLLKKRVSDISLMNLDKIPTDRVAFGSTVHLHELGGETVVYQLVMPEDADPSKGMISTASPIGRALVGKEVGDDVAVPTPNGRREFEVVKLITIHDE